MIPVKKYVKVVVSPTQSIKRSDVVNNTDLVVVENGLYEPEPPYTGFGKVSVDVRASSVIEPLSVSATTEQQIINAAGGVDGYAPITVNAVTSNIDSNIVAGNIKSGVTILGVTGDYSGTTPSGTYQITANGTYNISQYANVDVNVPSDAPFRVISCVSGKLEAYDTNREYGVNLSGIDYSSITDVGDFALAGCMAHINNPDAEYEFGGFANASGMYAYAGMCSYATFASFNFDEVISVSGYYAFFSCFYYVTMNGSINFSSLETVSGSYAFYTAFAGIEKQDEDSVVEFYFPELRSVSGYYAFGGAFSDGCHLTSVDFSSLETVSGSYAFSGAFFDSWLGNDIDLSSLKNVTGSNAFENAFGVTFIETITFNSLDNIPAKRCFYEAFYACDSLTDIYFPALKTTSFGNRYVDQFEGLVNSCDGVKLHFPSNLSSTISGLTGYPNFGGTNTTILFDLTATS